MSSQEGCVRWFETLSMTDVASVGGKNASLGEMYQTLRPSGVRLPNGFAVTIEAYKMALKPEDIATLHEALDPLDKSSPTFVLELETAGEICRDVVYQTELDPEHLTEILKAYRLLCKKSGSNAVAVRSSATAEDLPTASFAGQHDTYLNVTGEPSLNVAIKRCMASLFTDRAISYRIDQRFDHFKVFISVGIMKMVRSDLASSGVMFSIDTETGFRDAVFITGSFGLGENVVQGNVDPDEYYVHKPTFKDGYRAVLRRTLGKKQVMMVLNKGSTREQVKNRPTPRHKRQSYCLQDSEVLELADCAIQIEDHYARVSGKQCPMDIEWAIDGIDKLVYIVQARPETVVSQKDVSSHVHYQLEGNIEKHRLITMGRAVGTKISSGKVRVIHDSRDAEQFQRGDIIVADTTAPDWEPIMEFATGIITERGGRTCHASIVARELGIVAVVGAGDALARCTDGETVTISCAEGDIGRVYAGAVPFTMSKTDLSKVARPKTKMMINLGNPELAFGLSMLPCDGVGLARVEFIINEYIKAHPMALLHPERIDNAEDAAKIKELTRNYSSGAEFMIRQMSEGIGMIGAAFYPRPVVVRLTDFQSHEYASLLGAHPFEPKEGNPMLGLRGACRYIHPDFREGFMLDCKAILRIRNDMGLTNIIIMMPFVRTINEAEMIFAEMAKYGLRRGENGLKVYICCEIPNNVIQIDDFLKHFDGISIGTNDLTQLTLGVDRDSDLVANLFDERDAGVKSMMKAAIDGAKRNGAHSGICGQAPSDYPEIAKYLIAAGIDAISLTPDSLVKTIIAVENIENDL